MTAAGGGGDSSFTSRPWWQPATASQSTYPIVPDVAAFADASPALWDQKAAQPGWPKLGFVTPLLYSIAHKDAGSFLDIVTGTNTVFDTVSCCKAATGYDMASGLGSPLAGEVVQHLHH